jgi:hypothetical protein
VQVVRQIRQLDLVSLSKLKRPAADHFRLRLLAARQALIKRLLVLVCESSCVHHGTLCYRNNLPSPPTPTTRHRYGALFRAVCAKVLLSPTGSDLLESRTAGGFTDLWENSEGDSAREVRSDAWELPPEG